MKDSFGAPSLSGPSQVIGNAGGKFTGSKGSGKISGSLTYTGGGTDDVSEPAMTAVEL